jgi:hypothetical protein
LWEAGNKLATEWIIQKDPTDILVPCDSLFSTVDVIGEDEGHQSIALASSRLRELHPTTMLIVGRVDRCVVRCALSFIVWLVSICVL